MGKSMESWERCKGLHLPRRGEKKHIAVLLEFFKNVPLPTIPGEINYTYSKGHWGSTQGQKTLMLVVKDRRK